jgi:urease accessory protein UreF
MSGAQFRREVGADPAKWAAQFLAAYAQAEGVRTDADRLAFVTQWMSDAMDAAVRVAVSGGPDDPDDTEPGMRA